MAYQRTIKRYAAFFRGWCQAFGEHENEYDETQDINWLLADGQVGLILARDIKRAVYHELLGKERSVSGITLADCCVRVGEFTYPLDRDTDKKGAAAMVALLRANETLHMYLTYHFVYPRGTRIVTFSTRRPQGLIYKEIDPVTITVEAST